MMAKTVDEAIDYIKQVPKKGDGTNLSRFELMVYFDNDENVSAKFGSKKRAIEFLRNREKGIL